MTELLTAAQMRAIEQAAMDSGHITGLELMERAGRGVVDAVMARWPEMVKAPHRAVVLCGPGNNGGDGFVIARLLQGLGWTIDVFLLGEVANLPPDAAANARRWAAIGEILSIEDAWTLPDGQRRCDVVVDALFGTGLSRPLNLELTKELVEAFDNDRNVPGYPVIVSVDMPSGTCSDSGRLLRRSNPLYPSQCVFAHLTVTFHRPRVGHHLAADCTEYGDLAVVDIGLTDVPADTVNLTSGRHLLPKSPRVHKYGHGHALVFSGDSGKGGAARLAARGALRIGAGLVTLATPLGALGENAAALEAVMLATVDSRDDLSAEMQSRKINAVCIGPGFGVGGKLRAFVGSVLEAKTPAVFDADALTEFRDDPETLFAMLHDQCLLTPHEGEFGRLFPDVLAKLREPAARGPAYSKVDATREAAARAGCAVLFKGPDTVIAAPDGRCLINSAHYQRAAPWLATAGSGDVLAGLITGLLARGLSPMKAAETGAWLHVECARKFGPGLIAEDLPEQLPAVFRDLGL